MATYADLSDADRALVQAFMDGFRPLMADTARHFARLQRLQDAWMGGVSQIVSALDTDVVIEAHSGLVGAGELTAANVSQTMGDFQQAIAAFYGEANRIAYIRAAGLAQTI